MLSSPVHEPTTGATNRMPRKAGKQRVLTNAERELLATLPRHPIADLAAIMSAVHEEGDRWTWRYHTLRSPRTYDTFAQAVDEFEAYITALMELDRIERDGTGSP